MWEALLRYLFCALLVIGLAGCTSTSSLFTSNEPPQPPPPPAEGAMPQPGGPQGTAQGTAQGTGTVQAAPSGPMSPAASAAAPPGAERSGELMDCVTQSCRINCAANVWARCW